jgi:hypothetical protein
MLARAAAALCRTGRAAAVGSARWPPCHGASQPRCGCPAPLPRLQGPRMDR